MHCGLFGYDEKNDRILAALGDKAMPHACIEIGRITLLQLRGSIEFAMQHHLAFQDEDELLGLVTSAC